MHRKSVLYYLCVSPIATRPITQTAWTHGKYRKRINR
jgi:hypothetical protein